MKIIDINGKEREAISLTNVFHEFADIDGNLIHTHQVRAVIKEKNGIIREYWSLEDFRKRNPQIKI